MMIRQLLPWYKRRWLTLPPQELMQHGIIIGGSGTGKTVSLLRIAYLAAKVYHMKVFFIDAKGDRLTAARFMALMEMALMERAGRNRIALFPHEPFDGFRGDAVAIFNRLMAIEDYSEPFYRAAARKVLYAICQRMGDPPRDSVDLLSRLETLEARFRQERLIMGVEMRYSSFFNAIQGKLNGTWSYEDMDAAYFLLDGLALKEEASSLGRYLVEDFAHYAARRKRLEEQVLLIVDEYSALSSGTDAANLFERLRSFNAGVLIAAQSYDGLGKGAERILDAAMFIMMHRSPKPEPLIMRSGHRWELKEVYQVPSGASTVQLEDRPAIDPNEPRRLEPGEAILVTKGRWSKIKIAQAPIPDELQSYWLEILRAGQEKCEALAEDGWIPMPERL